MKKLILVGTICLSVAALIALFLVFEKSRNHGPKLYISEESWNFGAVKIGSDVKHTIIIGNKGDANLNLYAYPSCPDCIFPELEKYTIPPKSETKLHIKIVETVAGPYQGFITIDSNDSKPLAKKITIKGTFN